MKVPRDVNMANVKFIRVGGDAPPAAPPVTPTAPAAVDQAAGSGSGGVADAAAAAVGAGGPNPYPGDNATKAQIAAWMGREAEKRGLPKQLPVMASLVESGVKNLHFGDADSVGFFQMRVGIWNKGDYAGFPEKPELQVKWFLDQAEAVKKQRIAAGKSVTDPNQFGDWIADVERPAEQYRGRYGAAARRGQRAARAGRLGAARRGRRRRGRARPGRAGGCRRRGPAGAQARRLGPVHGRGRPGGGREEGRLGLVPRRPAARGPAERGGLRGVGAGHGRRRRRGGAGLRREHARRVGAEGRADPARRARAGRQHRRRGRQVPRRRRASGPATRGARAS